MSDEKQNKAGSKQNPAKQQIPDKNAAKANAAKPPAKSGRGLSRKNAASTPSQAVEQTVSLISNPLAQSAHKPVGSANKLTSSKEFKLKIIPLGGLGEVGKNMTIVQYGEQMIVVDAGIMFPEDELFGIDMVIPDYSYLVENRDKVLAFILTHGHEDHIGALPYVLRDVDVPVYGSALTLGLLEGKLSEFKQPAKMITVVPRQQVNIGSFSIEFIHVTHSIPDSFALAIHTPIGVVLFASDFKVDLSPIDGQMMDFGRLSALGERGVLLMLADSTNVEKRGFTPSEKTVGSIFDNIFLNAPGRIFVTSFASNVHRIQQAVWAATHTGRRVAIVGRGMQNVITVAKELGYLDLPQELLIDIDRINSLPAHKVLVLTTGSQGEPLSGLTRMASGEHRQVQIVPGDTVVISATPIPGHERLVGRIIDKLFKLGATVIHEKGEGIHVSGHANREDLMLLHNIVKPHFFMPVHGEYRMLVKHAKLAQQLGMKEENTFVLENGQVLEVSRRRCRINGQVPSGRVLIDGLGVGDVGNTVLKERRILSESGILLMHMVFTRKTNVRILAGPEVFSRGFIFEKEYEHIIEEIKERVTVLCSVENLAECSTYDLSNRVRSTLARFLLERTGRRPVILPIISEV
ncbi:MAG: ribonuclease J [Firmicutes bacterium]|nr:ribonuclease J [Bacillota bacterium]